MLLAGDVGGTHARFALYSPDGRRRLYQATLASSDHPSLEIAVRRFLATYTGADGDPVEAAAIGVAGPVIDGRCVMPNLPWVLDERVLARKLRIPRVVLLNDLVALALGALGLPRRKLDVIQGSRAPSARGGTVAMVAAGTGLGEALLVWDGVRHVPAATEGGHTDFAPRDALEWDLLEFLRERIGGRVSYERIVSGPGLGNIYDFFVERVRVREARATARAIAESIDRNRTISELGASGVSRPAERAVDLFLSLYGAEAGNLALKSLATGGVLVGGGIAAHLAPRLRRSAFLASFRDKGRMSELLSSIPIAIVLDADIGLSGAVRHAVTLVS